MTELENARIDAVAEVASAICLAVADVMIRHGDDPQGHEIVVAGFTYALHDIGIKIDKSIPIGVQKCLQVLP